MGHEVMIIMIYIYMGLLLFNGLIIIMIIMTIMIIMINGLTQGKIYTGNHRFSHEDHGSVLYLFP